MQSVYILNYCSDTSQLQDHDIQIIKFYSNSVTYEDIYCSVANIRLKTEFTGDSFTIYYMKNYF